MVGRKWEGMELLRWANWTRCPAEERKNILITTNVTGYHAFGVFARLDASDNGICAYVSPDNNVARIRLISNGELGSTLGDIYAPFPSDDYEMSFSCDDEVLVFWFEAVGSGQTWQLTASDPNPQSGGYGLLAGSEPESAWEWFEAESYGTGDAQLSAMEVDDDNAGWSSGNGDGAFEAGEAIELGLCLDNVGGDTLHNVSAVLQSLSSEISVPISNCDFGHIPPGESVWSLSDYGVEAEVSAPEDETYPFRLTVFADGGYSSVHEFDLPLGCGIEFDMEGDTDAWYTTSLGSGWGDQWHQSGQRNHTPEGSESFKCGDTGYGDYDDGLHGALVSPLFNVPHDATLSFWMWIDAQCVRSGEAYDGGRLQIGQLGSWEDLEPLGGYPYQIVSETTGPFEPGTGVWSGTAGWQEQTWEIPEEFSGPRRLRWVFGSDQTGSREGWFIDDLVVEGLMGTAGESGSPIPGNLQLSAAPNPFHSAVGISVSGLLPGETAQVEIYDLAGRKVFGTAVGSAEGGHATVSWSGGSAGLYLVRATRDGEIRTIRVVRTE